MTLRTILEELVSLDFNKGGITYPADKISQAEQKIKELMMTEQEIANILLKSGWNWDGVRRFKSATAIHSAMVEKMEKSNE